MRKAKKHLTQYDVFMVGQLRNERNFVTWQVYIEIFSRFLFDGVV